MQFSLESKDLEVAIQDVNELQKRHIPFGVARGLTQTAKDAQANLEKQSNIYIDSPIRFSQKAFRVQPATKKTLEAGVFVKDIQSSYFDYLVHGGEQRPEHSEAIAVPANIRLNKFGNIPGMRQGKIKKLLDKPDHFSGTIKGVAGIWRRIKARGGKASRRKARRNGTKVVYSVVKLIAAWAKSQSKQKQFPFYDLNYELAEKHLTKNIKSSIDKAASDS